MLAYIQSAVILSVTSTYIHTYVHTHIHAFTQQRIHMCRVASSDKLHRCTETAVRSRNCSNGDWRWSRSCAIVTDARDAPLWGESRPIFQYLAGAGASDGSEGEMARTHIVCPFRVSTFIVIRYLLLWSKERSLNESTLRGWEITIFVKICITTVGLKNYFFRFASQFG